jgi:hypothetical protein
VVRGRVVGSGFGVVDRGRVVRSRLGGISRGGVVRSGLGGVVRSRLGGRVVRSGFGGIGSRGRVVRLVVGFTFVLDVGNVAVLVVGVVGDDLGATVGKGNTVFTGDHAVVVLGFLLGEIGTRVFVFHSIFVGERPRGQLVLGSGVVGSRLGVIGSRGGVVGGGCRGVVRSWVVGAVGHGQSQSGGQNTDNCKHCSEVLEGLIECDEILRDPEIFYRPFFTPHSYHRPGLLKATLRCSRYQRCVAYPSISGPCLLGGGGGGRHGRD